MARNEISDQTRDYLLYIVARLRNGYTGSFEVVCNEGGIQRVREGHNVDLDGPEARGLASEEEIG